jgi:hypothetical protein
MIWTVALGVETSLGEQGFVTYSCSEVTGYHDV